MQEKTFSYLDKAAVLITIGTSFLIVVGVLFKFGFYGSDYIDALWIISLFSPIDFMFSNFEILIYYFLAFLYLTKIIEKENKNRRFEFIYTVCFLLVLSAMMIVSMSIPLILCLSVIGSFIAFYFIIYTDKYLIKTFGLTILLFIPWYSGYSFFKNSGVEKLPKVYLSQSVDKKDWYLLDKYTDKAILINKDKTRNYFKMVEMKDIKLIENTL